MTPPYTNYISSGAYSDDVHRNLRTGQIYGDAIATSSVAFYFVKAAEVSETLDAMKKTLFYGKDAAEKASALNPGRDRIGTTLDHYDIPVDLFHGALGVLTETGEIAKAFHETLHFGKPLDKVNLCEEIGDQLWYLSVMAKGLGSTLEECAHLNTAKLRKRFPGNFTEDAALHRDLTGERAILETQPDTGLPASYVSVSVGGINYSVPQCDLNAVIDALVRARRDGDPNFPSLEGRPAYLHPALGAGYGKAQTVGDLATRRAEDDVPGFDTREETFASGSDLDA